MRQLVAKPGKQLTAAQPSARVHTPSHSLHVSKMSPSMIRAKTSSEVIDPVRAQRANEALRSQAVQRFQAQQLAVAPTTSSSGSGITLIHPPVASKLVNVAAPAAVTPRPAPVPPPMAAPVSLQPAAAVQPQRPIAAQQVRAARPRAAMDVSRPGSSARRYTPMTAQTAATAYRQNNDTALDQSIFDQALSSATSHEEPAPHESTSSKIKRGGKKRKRGMAIVASLALFVALCGFVAVQNRENIQLQLASAKAGFSVSSPLYRPDGYSLNKMTYSAGLAASLYKNQSNQSFTLSQKKSNWDSQTLLENFVATKGDSYKGYQSNGRTVYVFGEGNATWVNGGIWYQIQGADQLTNEQLVKIAASM
jgi:hypothetical protein